MADIQVNTMNITLDEYKNSIEEIAKANALVKSKEEIISNLEKTITNLENDVYNANVKAGENSNILFVSKLNRWNADGEFVKLQKNDPAIIELIKSNYDAQVKSIQEELNTVNERLTESFKLNDKAQRELRENKTEEIKKLNKQLEQLKEDYENLKLDKAANLVEAERLEEINRLKEQIIELGRKDSYTLEGFRTWLPWYVKPFAKYLYDYTENLYNGLQSKKHWDRVDATSALGKAKDYLKTLQERICTNTMYYRY